MNSWYKSSLIGRVVQAERLTTIFSELIATRQPSSLASPEKKACYDCLRMRKIIGYFFL